MSIIKNIKNFYTNLVNNYAPQAIAQIASSPRLNRLTDYISAGRERVINKPISQYFLPTADTPFKPYVQETARSAYETGKSALKTSIPYLGYRYLKGKPVSLKEYVGDVANTGLGFLNTAYRASNIAPVLGAGFGAAQGYRKTGTTKGILQSAYQGINSQPFIGEVLSPKNEGTAANINLATIPLMLLMGGVKETKTPKGSQLTDAVINQAKEKGASRGVIKALEDRIDSLLGTGGSMTGNWKTDYAIRQKSIENASAMGAPESVVSEVNRIQEALANIREMKAQGAAKIFKEAGKGKTKLEGLLTESPAQTAYRRESGLKAEDIYTGEKKIRSWEDAVQNDVNLNTKRLQTFEREQEYLDKATGVKAYKGGRVQDVSSGFPSRELLGFNTKDRSAFSYQRETLLRNIEDTFQNPKAATKVKEYFYKPVIENETANVKFQNDLYTQLRDVFNKAGIKKGSNEDYAAADFIEQKISLPDLQKQYPDKWEGIVKAAQTGREIYKSLLTRINQTLSKFGYEPIPERKDYVTHTQEIQTFFDVLGNLTNLSSEKLPTAMSSIHITTKPGRTFFKYRLQRNGGSTHEGLITALEKYIPSAGNQIFHTGDIQRGRALEQYIMKQNEGTQYRNLSNFESYLSQYVDSLAGKQNILDRPVEKLFGRKILSVGDTVRRRTGANMVGGNVSSAITNFIPFTQSVATTPKIDVIKGLYKAALSPAEGITKIDGVDSAFLLRRFPEQKIQLNFSEKLSNAASYIFKMVDAFTSKSIVAGKYYEGIEKGMSSLDAMKFADEYAARVMADRSFGQTPLLFNSKMLGAFTQFQVEVNNQMSFLLKDIPKNSGYNQKQVASALAQFVIYSYVFNNIFEQITGRRPQIDILHAGINAYRKIKNQEDITNIINPADQKTPVGEIVQNLPFASTLTGGRIPIGSAVPNLLSVAAGESSLGTELKKPLFYFLPPTAGGQLRKTYEGLRAYNEGASYTPTGRKRFDIQSTPGNFIKSALFGPYSTQQGQTYINSLGQSKSRVIYNQYKKLKAKSPQEASKMMSGVLSTDPDLYKQVLELRNEELLGVTKEEKRLKNLPVKDGSRARAVAQILRKFQKGSERSKKINDLIKKGIISNDVYSQLVVLKNKGQL